MIGTEEDNGRCEQNATSSLVHYTICFQSICFRIDNQFTYVIIRPRQCCSQSVLLRSCAVDHYVAFLLSVAYCVSSRAVEISCKKTRFLGFTKKTKNPKGSNFSFFRFLEKKPLKSRF